MQKLKKTGTIHDTPTGYDFNIDEKLRPMRAIRIKCLDCCGSSSPEVEKCPVHSCTLYPYRFGKTGIKRHQSPENRASTIARLSKARECKKNRG